jgi:hypothetical protein
MALLYGEGARKAFIRLQVKIMAQTHDESIFTWNFPEPKYGSFLSLLAESPAWFKDSGHIFFFYYGARPIEQSYLDIIKEEFSLKRSLFLRHQIQCQMLNFSCL